MRASEFVLRGPGAFLEHLPVPNGALPGIGCQLEVLGQLQRIHRAGILAKAAEHTAGKIVREICKVFTACLLVAFAADDDQGFRTCQRAQIASDAEGLSVVGIDVEPRRSAIALSHLRPLTWILLSIDVFRVLIAKSNPQPLEQ